MAHEGKEYDNLSFFKLVEAELEDCGSARIRVKGWSMQPMIMNMRDDVLIDKRNDRVPVIGDICLFRYNGNYILHRYKYSEGDIMVMQGDNLFTFERCRLNDVVGIVRVVYHNGKETSPKSVKWRVITRLHRSYKSLRNLAVRIIRKIVRMIK